MADSGVTNIKRERSKEIYIVGPTAIGKSKIAIYVANQLGGEIVSADSMQVYKGFPIATDHPRAEQLHKIPHHMIGFVDPEEYFTVQDYIERATVILENIHKKNQYSFIVGGSGMYIRSLIDGVFTQPENSKSVENLVEISFASLEKIDPTAAKKIHPNDQRRIERAVSFYNQTGVAISSLQNQWDDFESGPQHYFGLMMPKEDLTETIDRRVEEMISQGLESEAKTFYELKNNNATLKQAIGLKEFVGYFEKKISLDEVIKKIKIHSHQLAKKQRTWFGKDSRIQWIDGSFSRSVEEIGDEILEKISR